MWYNWLTRGSHKAKFWVRVNTFLLEPKTMNYAKIYKSIIEKRKYDNLSGYTETHHIIPRCLGGSDDRDNLVRLTAKEHFICHLLLTKMYPKGSNEYYKMGHAFLMMLVSSKEHGTNRYVTARKYENFKILRSVFMSMSQKGEKNSQYGTKWIHNKELKQCKKVPKDAILEDGWSKGRITNWNLYNKKCLSCENIIINEKLKTLCLTCIRNERVKISLNNFCKKCSINGIIYNSVGEAAKELGIKRNSLQYRINSKRFENYFYINSSIV